MPVVQSDNIPTAGATGFNHNFETKDVSIPYRGNMNAVIERVLLTCNEEEQYLVKVLIAQCRFFFIIKN
jgi:DNA-directed RNA polymerase beta subunit